MTKTVLITGASSGIGEAFCHVFAQKKYNLILMASNKTRLDVVAEKIKEKYQVLVDVRAVDFRNIELLSQEIDDLLKIYTIDVLINNAGFGVRGPLAKSNTHEQLGMIQVNIAALTLITQKVLPAMVKRRAGKVMNVASTAAYQPGPFMAVYFASKSFVLSFSEAIAEEVRGQGITVTALCPGPTSTHFFSRARVISSNFFSKAAMMTPEAVAEAGYKGLMQGDTVVVAGILNNMGALTARYLPHSVIFRLMNGFGPVKKKH